MTPAKKTTIEFVIENGSKDAVVKAKRSIQRNFPLADVTVLSGSESKVTVISPMNDGGDRFREDSIMRLAKNNWRI